MILLISNSSFFIINTMNDSIQIIADFSLFIKYNDDLPYQRHCWNLLKKKKKKLFWKGKATRFKDSARILFLLRYNGRTYIGTSNNHEIWTIQLSLTFYEVLLSWIQIQTWYVRTLVFIPGIKRINPSSVYNPFFWMSNVTPWPWTTWLQVRLLHLSYPMTEFHSDS